MTTFKEYYIIEEGAKETLQKWVAAGLVSAAAYGMFNMGRSVHDVIVNLGDPEEYSPEQKREIGGEISDAKVRDDKELDPSTLDTSPIGPPPPVLNPATRPLDSGHKPEVKPVAATFDSGFLDYMKRVENSIKKGFKGGKWYPHSSVEGGKKTIAYGHKLKTGEDFSKGLTDEQAVTLLKQDLNYHKAGAKGIVDKKYGAGTFDKLDTKRQEMLIDIQFNIRNGLTKFTSFMHAVVKNDKKGMLKHYVRKYRDPKTKKWLPIKDRNNQFKKRYLPSKEVSTL